MVFQPNIVIDAKLGCLWHINLRLSELLHQVPDLGVCTQLALKRANAKPILLKVMQSKYNSMLMVLILLLLAIT